MWNGTEMLRWPESKGPERRICFIADNLLGPQDEGIRKFASSLLAAWPAGWDVLALSPRASGPKNGVIPVKTNRLLLGRELWERVRRFRPEIVCYVPSSSATLFGLLRSRILKLYWPRARVVMVALQPRPYGWLGRTVAARLAPDRVLVQSRRTGEALGRLGFRVGFVPGGVDVERFSPVSAERKAALRAKHGLDPKSFTILHVGHLSGLRNIESLPWVRHALGCQVVLVVSSLHSENRGLLDSLRERGVIVLDRYLPNIEEVYQLSDCYLFPVLSEQASIEVPLSVLEAMSCNLPVVSTRYGGLPDLFREGEGLFFINSGIETLSALERVRSLDCCRTREKVLPYSWQAVAGSVISLARAEGAQ